MSYVAPQFESTAFTCPHCSVLAQFHWAQAHHEVKIAGMTAGRHMSEVFVAYCHSCKNKMLWLRDGAGTRPVYPSISTAPPPHADLPQPLRAEYEEARSILGMSPRGAAALLRLLLQRLCKELGESGENINADIASLVQKGLPSRVQQALDIVRVVGNNAVHPGTIDINDDPEIARRLFALVNLIVENRISEPKQIDALYQSLPATSLEAIRRRDG